MRVFLSFFAAIIFCAVFFGSHLVYAQQGSHKLDSLEALYNKQTTDSEKVNLLIELSLTVSCEDTANKLKYAMLASALAEKIKWDEGKIRANNNLGNYYSDCRQDYLSAVQYYRKNEYPVEMFGDTLSQTLLLQLIAYSYQKATKYPEALEYYMQVLTLAQDQDAAMGALGNMGVIYNNIGDYNRALSCYNRSLKILDDRAHSKKTADMQYTITRGGLLINIGDIYLTMSEPDKALENYNNVYKIGQLMNNKVLELYSHAGMGKSYMLKKSYDKAIENFQLALEDGKFLNNFEIEGNTLNELARVYLEQGNLTKAMENVVIAQKLAEEHGNNEQLPLIYTLMGQLYLRQKQYGPAINYLQKAIAIFEKTGALDDEKNAWEALSNTYRAMKQPDKALEAYMHFITLKDSVFSIVKSNELTRADLQSQFSKKQMADSLKQASVYKVKMEREHVYTYAGFIALGLVVLSSFFIYRNYHTQKKYNRLLSKEKVNHLAHIRAQSSVLTNIAYVQSHEVRGNVSTIMGLVQVFNAEDPTDPNNKEVIDGIAAVADRLDRIVQEMISKENKVSQDPEFKDPEETLL